MKNIIINGDDFGMNERNSHAIAEAFEKGLITDTTLMANEGFFQEAVAMAKEQGIADHIGIHLNLTQGVPLTEDIKGQARFVKDGCFCKGYDHKSPLTKGEESAIYTELKAQVERIQNAGIRINHADSHHHVHTDIYIAPIAAKICKEHGIDKIRLCRNLRKDPGIDHSYIIEFHQWLKKQGFITTDYFAYVMDINGAELPDNTEIMVHPDYDKSGVLIDRRGMKDGYPVGDPLIDLRSDKDITLRSFTE